MSIDLTGLGIASATPSLMEFGGLLTPALGGPVQRIERPGARWAWVFETRPYRIEPEGRQWAARLVQAKRQGALMRVSQPDLDVGIPGLPVVTPTISSGRTVSLSGLTQGYLLRSGQWVSAIVGGRRYLDQVDGDAVSRADGTMTFTLANLIRTPLPWGTVIEIAEPKIEGWITDVMQWSMPQNRVVSFTFTIVEAA